MAQGEDFVLPINRLVHRKCEEPLGSARGQTCYPDLIWRHATSGANVAWYLAGSEMLGQSSLPGVTDTNWILRP